MHRRRTAIALAAAVLLVLLTGSASAGWLPGAPPSPPAATRAFGRLLHSRYGNEPGYRTCPAAQVEGDYVTCWGEVHAGATRHFVFAAASLRAGGSCSRTSTPTPGRGDGGRSRRRSHTATARRGRR